MSPFITAYVNLSALVPLPPAYVAFLGGSVASASAGDPATVTSSPNATVMLIIRPVPYVPLALADVTFSTDCAWAAGSARDRRGCGAAALSHTPPPQRGLQEGRVRSLRGRPAVQRRQGRNGRQRQNCQGGRRVPADRAAQRRAARFALYNHTTSPTAAPWRRPLPCDGRRRPRARTYPANTVAGHRFYKPPIGLRAATAGVEPARHLGWQVPPCPKHGGLPIAHRRHFSPKSVATYTLLVGSVRYK